MMLVEAGSYAQAWHNVQTARNSEFNMLPQKQTNILCKARLKSRLATMCTQPALVHLTCDYKNKLIFFVKLD
jgi:hypothetical protein